MISNILQKVINNETVRYVVSGIFTMAIGVGVYQGFLLLGLDYKISNLISLVAGKMSAYICNKFFVFKVRNTSFSEWIKEFLRFIFARGATLFIDYFGLIFLVEVVEFNKKDDFLESLTIKTNDKLNKLEVKACFIFIGYVPATDFLNNLDILDEKGYIKTDKNLKTDIPFIYACGDTINKEVYQIVTATGEGAVSAISFINDYNS